MKPARRRAQARSDILDTARYYREAARAAVAQRFAQAVKDAVAQLEANPGIESPRLGQEIGVADLRTWRLRVFPAALWYFERSDHLDIVRLVGERQDPLIVDVPATPVSKNEYSASLNDQWFTNGQMPLNDYLDAFDHETFLFQQAVANALNEADYRALLGLPRDELVLLADRTIAPQALEGPQS